jgi:hypothetical protein
MPSNFLRSSLDFKFILMFMFHDSADVPGYEAISGRGNECIQKFTALLSAIWDQRQLSCILL